MQFNSFSSDIYESATNRFSFEHPASPFSVEGPQTAFQQSFDFDRAEMYNFSDDIPDSQLRATELPAIQGPMPSVASDYTEAEATAPELALSTEGFAAPAAFATHALLESFSQSQYQSDLQGNSSAGHSYLAPLQAASNLNTHNLQNNVASALVGVGAMFGPEGLAAGLAAGSIASSLNFNTPVSVPTDTGEQISSDQLVS